MTREEEIKKAVAEINAKYHYNALVPACIEAAQWADAHPIHYDGKALLYVCGKTAQRAKKDMIQKGLKWLEEKFYFNSLHHAVENNTYKSMEELFDDFKKAMEK